jgi:hypothetical protein
MRQCLINETFICACDIIKIPSLFKQAEEKVASFHDDKIIWILYSCRRILLFYTEVIKEESH